MTSLYRRHTEIRLTALAGEGVVLHLGARRYFTVNETGLTLLEALKSAKTFDQLVAAILEEYEVDRETAVASTQTFLDRCGAAGLLIEEGQ